MVSLDKGLAAVPYSRVPNSGIISMVGPKDCVPTISAKFCCSFFISERRAESLSSEPRSKSMQLTEGVIEIEPTFCTSSLFYSLSSCLLSWILKSKPISTFSYIISLTYLLGAKVYCKFTGCAAEDKGVYFNSSRIWSILLFVWNWAVPRDAEGDVAKDMASSISTDELRFFYETISWVVFVDAGSLSFFFSFLDGLWLIYFTFILSFFKEVVATGFRNWLLSRLNVTDSTFALLMGLIYMTICLSRLLKVGWLYL